MDKLKSPRKGGLCGSDSTLLSRVKIFIFLAIMLPLILSANPLQDLQWKRRVLVVEVTDDEEYRHEVLTELRKSLAELKDREMVVIELSKGEPKLPLSLRLIENERVMVRNYVELGKKEAGRFVLLGKDGGVKARQDRLDLGQLFALIDQMPMRRVEMKRR